MIDRDLRIDRQLPTAAEFETSATYVQALIRALEQEGQLQAVLGSADPDVKELIQNPHARPWWDARRSVAFTHTVVEVGGPFLLQRVGKIAVFESIAPVLRPVITVLIAIGGPSPAALLSRFSQLARVAVSNVEFEWLGRTETAGSMVIRFSQPVPENFASLWQGAFDYIFETTQVQGSRTLSAHDGGVMKFELAWTSPAH
jgi:hypothetical protein